MKRGGQEKVPVLLMVSGGSDSTALLELVAKYLCGAMTISFRLDPKEAERSALVAMIGRALPPADLCDVFVLHVNHLLRGRQSDDDEAFVVARCRAFGIPCTVRRVDVGELAAHDKDGVEAVARKVRYKLADEVLNARCAELGVEASRGIICTAHTLDDRVETFYMRSLVGTGPGGLASIPRVRGRIRRPLLDAKREELRAWLRYKHAGDEDFLLWREDPTNEDGSNFRSQVRMELMPVLGRLRPGFESSLARTMDLIEAEDRELSQAADSSVYRNLRWDGEVAALPLSTLADVSRSLARRILRAVLLVVNPAARLESAQIERVLEGSRVEGFTTETSGGIRVNIRGDWLYASREQ